VGAMKLIDGAAYAQKSAFHIELQPQKPKKILR
jgi:hypothetical protein